MRLATDGGRRTVPPVVAWAVVDCDTGRTWGGTLDSDYTSNQAEYYALIHALKIGLTGGPQGVEPEGFNRRAKTLRIISDSELMVRHVNGQYKCRDAKLIPLLEQVKDLITQFPYFELIHVPREQNEAADTAVNKVMDDYITMHSISRY